MPAARQGGLGGRRRVDPHAELRESERERLVGACLELHHRHARHEVARKSLASGRGGLALQLEARDRDPVADTVAHHELQRHKVRGEHEKDQTGRRRPNVAPVPPGEAPHQFYSVLSRMTPRTTSRKLSARRSESAWSAPSAYT